MAAAHPPAVSSVARGGQEYAVSLLRGIELGIDVSHKDNHTLLVTRVNSAGSVNKHNKSCRSRGKSAEHLLIMPGDRILEVNGLRGQVHDMISRIKNADELKMTLRRLEEVLVHVELPRGSLHYDLQAEVLAVHADGVSLEVTWVHGSLIMTPVAIERGDRIVEINGRRGDSTRLSWELEDAQVPAAVVIRRFRR